MCKINWNSGIVTLKSYKDNRGELCPVSLQNDLPFTPKRIFFTSNVPSSDCTRGEHAHFEEEQVILCAAGKIKIMLYDGLFNSFIPTYLLIVSQAIYIPKLTWNYINFEKPDSVSITFSSTEYNEHDYIRNLQQFEIIKRGYRIV